MDSFEMPPLSPFDIQFRIVVKKTVPQGQRLIATGAPGLTMKGGVLQWKIASREWADIPIVEE